MQVVYKLQLRNDETLTIVLSANKPSVSHITY